MYEGYPDFQRIISAAGQRFIGAWQQNNTFFLYPDALRIQAADPLPFSLDIIRSSSTETVYGSLNFTTELLFGDEQSLTDFKTQYPDSAVNSLPVLPGGLGFDVPIEYHSDLRGQHYDASGYSAQCIQFIILLNSAATQLIESTLLDKTIGFNARVDGFVQGVSPRLPYNVAFDPRELMLKLAAAVPDAYPVDDNRVVFGYDALTQYLYKHIATLPVSPTPALPENDPAATRLFCEAFLDRLYNLLGSPCSGPASSNVATIALAMPPQPGRVIFDLSRITLSLRPLCFILDPFTAAQQIASRTPDAIIHRTTTPPLPADKREIDVFYTVPAGLSSSVALDIQLTLPAGDIYPWPQTQTQALTGEHTQLTFRFQNSDVDTLPFSYQLRVNYFQDDRWHALCGAQQICSQRVLVLDSTLWPCRFLTLSLDAGFARQSRITGTWQSDGWQQAITLTGEAPNFSAPLLGEESYAEVQAHELSGDVVVPLVQPITQSTTIGAWSFPQFGAQRARITVNLGTDIRDVLVEFEPQSQTRSTTHTFTHSQNTFDYGWTVTSIFASGFRYRVAGGQWSAWVNGDQTINREGPK